MEEQFSRSVCLFGEEGLKKLNNSKVAVFGLGGVGGYVVEALARAGVGSIDLVDGDRVALTNLNRQIFALHDTLNTLKCTVAHRRIKAINPHICANEHPFYFNSQTQDRFDFSAYDYVVDAIDDVQAKTLLAVCCKESGTPIISCMGTGNKLNPMGFKVADIYSTNICPLARVMRRELKAAGIEKLKVVYSEEPPAVAAMDENGKRVPASVSFVPGAAGLLIASEVVKDLINGKV